MSRMLRMPFRRPGGGLLSAGAGPGVSATAAIDGILARRTSAACNRRAALRIFRRSRSSRKLSEWQEAQASACR